MQIPSLKQSAAWVTDLTDSYRFNPFVQATVNIVALQVVLAVLLVGISSWAILHTQDATVGTYHQYAVQRALGIHQSTSTIPVSIAAARDRTIAYTLAIVFILNALFGYLLIRFALFPTRKTLQLQKRFIGNIAHEIRTPLAIIKTSSEVALMDPKLATDVKETFQDTISELNRISEILTNLLSFDTLIRPERMKFAPVSLASLAQEVIDRLKDLADSRGVTLLLMVKDTRNVIMGNQVALEEVMINLLKNAINYTPAHQNGSVTVSIEHEFKDRVSLCVMDTGIGIAQKDLMHIFEPFYRGDTSRARNIGTGSSGLGLAIVNEIARLHRATISVRSTPGAGTQIKISFALANPAQKASSTLPYPEDEGSEITIDFS